MNITIKGELALEILNRFPKQETLTLAKKLVNDNPSVYTSVENARIVLKYYRNSRTGRKNEIYYRAETNNYFDLPDTEAEDSTPFVIPESIKSLLVLSDAHIPYHDLEALSVAIQYGKDNNVDGVLLNGDILDFYMLSRFIKDPRKRNFANELEAGRQFLRVLKNELNCPIYYKLGNHEDRYEHYLFLKAKELLDVDEFRLDVLLRFREYDTFLIKDKRKVLFGKLPILHGHEFAFAGGGTVNPARSLFLKTIHTGLVAHSHISSSHSETDINGKLISTWSVGCLCGLYPDYAKYNKWSHGFAYITRDNGTFRVDNKRIYKGQIL